MRLLVVKVLQDKTVGHPACSLQGDYFLTMNVQLEVFFWMHLNYLAQPGENRRTSQVDEKVDETEGPQAGYVARIITHVWISSFSKMRHYVFVDQMVQPETM